MHNKGKFRPVFVSGSSSILSVTYELSSEPLPTFSSFRNRSLLAARNIREYKLPSKFNIIHDLVQGLGLAYQGRTFIGASEQFWPDVLPAVCRHQRPIWVSAGNESRLAGCKSLTLH